MLVGCTLVGCTLVGCGLWTPDLDLRGDPVKSASPPQEPDANVPDPVDVLLAGEFGQAVQLTELGSAQQELDLTLTDDELEIFFVRQEEGVGDIWTALRGKIGDTWQAPTLVNDLSTAGERDPEVSGDGLRIGLSSIREGAPNHNDLYEATRPRRTAPWSKPFAVAELRTPSSECCATTDETGLHVVFASDSAGSLDLYEAERSSLGEPWMNVRPLPELNTEGDDSNPQFRAGGRVVVFDSDRSGAPGVELTREIYIAHRASLDAPFGEPEALRSVNTEADERDAWLSLDGRRIYFISDRSGDFETWMAER